MALNHLNLLNTSIGNIVSDRFEPVVTEPSVTQATDGKTAVALDAEWGIITTFPRALVAGAADSVNSTFAFNNNFIRSNSIISFTVVPGTAVPGATSIIQATILNHVASSVQIRLANLGGTDWGVGTFIIRFTIDN